MTAGHSHKHGGDESSAPAQVRRLLFFCLAPVIVLTLLGLVLLWPGERNTDVSSQLGFDASLYDAEITEVDSGPCASDPDRRCRVITARVDEGPDEGQLVVLPEETEGGASIDLRKGDGVVLGYSPDAPPELAYAFADFQRDMPLWTLGILFVAAVLVLGRRQGLFALIGLAISLLLLVRFVLPAILDGSNALVVAVVGSAAIMLVALYLAHGFSARTTTAVLGTLASLALTGVLGLLFVSATKLTGLYSEEATYLQVAAEQINLRGLLLGGMIIGSLGVLDDVTVTQVSAVWELHRANAKMPARELYSAALRIGRDHIASTVNTLVLAYAGASLPLLVLFVEVDRSLSDVITGEVVAIEVVRTLVGSIGLIASVPITTALAAAVVTRGPVGSGAKGRSTLRR